VSPQPLEPAQGAPRAWAAALAAALLLLALFAWRPLSDWDLGDHLACGQRILAQGPRWQGYPLVFTYASHPFTNLSWLWQAGVYALARSWGFGALTALNLGLSLALGLALALRLRAAGLKGALPAALLALAAVAAESRMQLRPEQASWLLLALQLLCLEQARAGRRGWLWAVPALHLLWANTHGNLALLGLLSQAAFLLGAWLRQRRFPKALGLCLGLSLLAGLATPFGLAGLLHPLRLASRLQQGDAFKAVVGEFMSPWASLPRPYPWASVWAYRLAAPLMLALQALAWRRLRLEDQLLCAGFFLVSLSGVRNTPLFFIAALPAAGQAAQALAGPWRPLLGSRAAAWALAGLLLLAGARVASGAWYASEGRQQRLASGIQPGGRLPLGAAAYIKAWAPQARFFNSAEYGGWLCWATGHAVFQDGQTEVMEQETYQSLIEPSLAPGGLGRLLDAQGLDLLVYHRPNYETYTRQLLALPGWRLAYYDDWAAVWMRDGAFSQAPRVDWAAEALAAPALPPDRDARLALGPPPSLGRFLSGFWQSPASVAGEANKAAFAWQCGAEGLAEALLWDALAKDPGSAQAWHNLGILLTSQGRYPQALLAWRDCLACDPDDSAAREACRQLGGA